LVLRQTGALLEFAYIMPKYPQHQICDFCHSFLSCLALISILAVRKGTPDSSSLRQRYDAKHGSLVVGHPLSFLSPAFFSAAPTSGTNRKTRRSMRPAKIRTRRRHFVTTRIFPKPKVVAFPTCTF
jgi:hypothetical protein